MTSRHLWSRVAWVVAFYSGMLALGLLIRLRFPGPDSIAYSTYKDLVPLVIAIPAAYLAFCFQQRHAYVQALRILWGNTISAVQAARTYTDTPHPSWDQFSGTLAKLGMIIDEVRAVYLNVPDGKDPKGWFPFEPIRQIYWEVRDLGHGESVTAEHRQRARERIEEMWRLCRDQLLAEFDREVPTHHHAGYVTPLSPGHERQQRTKRVEVISDPSGSVAALNELAEPHSPNTALQWTRGQP